MPSARTKDYHLAVSRETATLLYMLARSAKATSIVEFGMSFGISTLHLAAALEDNGGGRVITTEFEQSKVAHARANFEAAGLAHRVEIREGDALETLARNLPDSIDLVLLDGAKSLYPRVLSLLAPRLHAGSWSSRTTPTGAPNISPMSARPAAITCPCLLPRM